MLKESLGCSCRLRKKRCEPGPEITNPASTPPSLVSILTLPTEQQRIVDHVIADLSCLIGHATQYAHLSFANKKLLYHMYWS